MNRTILGRVFLTAVLMAWPVRVLADETADTFNSLYGEEVKRAKASADPKDDVALAGRLLAAAKALNGQPALLAVICENAYALGLREPSGLEIAIEAMELEIASVPEKKADCQQKILALRLRQFNASKGEERLPAAMPLLDALLAVAEDRKAAGDYDGAIALCRQALGVANAEVPDSKEEITAKMAAITQAKQKAAELTKLEAALKANPNDDPKRKQLLWLYLVDMNNPAEAVKWVRDEDDPDIRKYVPAAAKDVSEAPELACLELGDWYLGLSDKAGTVSQGAMLERAQQYYARFLLLHEADDLQRAKATLGIQKVETALEKLPNAPTASRWVELLRLVRLPTDAVAGRWAFTKAGLGVTAASYGQYPRVTIPAAPDGSYELKVEFIRSEKNGDVWLLLPVGDNIAMLSVSSYSGEMGIMNGYSYGRFSGTSRQPVALEGNRSYTLSVTVTQQGDQANITMELDGKTTAKWSGATRTLYGGGSYWNMPHPKCIGLGVYRGTVGFRSMKCHVISGSVKLGRAAVSGSPATSPS